MVKLFVSLNVDRDVEGTLTELNILEIAKS